MLLTNHWERSEVPTYEPPEAYEFVSQPFGAVRGANQCQRR